MQPTAQKIHTSIARPEKFPLLIVSPYADDCSAVRQILQNPCWQIDYARNLDEAGKSLQHKVVSVILCERDLPDGTWKDLLTRTRELSVIPSVLVVSRHADDSLWADVLNSGGYDVLPKPFDRRETVRVISMAWRQCYARSSRKLPTFEPVFAQAATG
jgi:DNA-binding response OmpR family regulator